MAVDPSDPVAPADDHHLAALLATEAGQLLLDLRVELIAAGAPMFRLRDEGDRRSHEFLVDRLGEFAPGDAVLSEEGRDGADRLGADRVWILDPLDGTREYGEPPRDDWAVHVALVRAGVPVAGAVALPAKGVTLATEPVPPVTPRPPGPPRVIVSRTRPPPVAVAVAEAIGGQLVAMGSAGAKVGAVVMGEADVYAHAGGQYEWDSCAPVAVAVAAGLFTSRLDGGPLVYNRPDTWLPDLVVCRRDLAEQVLAVTRRY